MKEYKGIIDKFFGTPKKAIKNGLVALGITAAAYASTMVGFQIYFNKSLERPALDSNPLTCLKLYSSHITS